MIVLVAPKVNASRPPKRQTTGTPHARAKNIKRICFSGNIEDIKHIYSCKIYNVKKAKIEYENIYGEDVRKEEKFLRHFRITLERELKQTDNSRIPGRADPL